MEMVPTEFVWLSTVYPMFVMECSAMVQSNHMVIRRLLFYPFLVYFPMWVQNLQLYCLVLIISANAELIYRVLMLQETVGRALKISQEASARMEELQIQLSVLQRQCTYRDRPLCDTLRIRSFEENGIIDALKTVRKQTSKMSKWFRTLTHTLIHSVQIDCYKNYMTIHVVKQHTYANFFL